MLDFIYNREAKFNSHNHVCMNSRAQPSSRDECFFPPDLYIFIRIVVNSPLKLMRYPVLSHWRSPGDLGVVLSCFLFPEVVNGEQLRGRSFLAEQLNPLGPAHLVAQAIGPGWHFMGLYWHKEMWTTFMTVHLSQPLILAYFWWKASHQSYHQFWLGYWHCSSSTSSTIMAWLWPHEGGSTVPVEADRNERCNYKGNSVCMHCAGRIWNIGGFAVSPSQPCWYRWRWPMFRAWTNRNSSIELAKFLEISSNGCRYLLTANVGRSRYFLWINDYQINTRLKLNYVFGILMCTITSQAS